METRAFAPLYGPVTANTTAGALLASVTITASATHAGANLPGALSKNGQCQIQIANTTTQWAYVQFGQSGSVTVSTVATGYPVAPGGVVVVSVPSEVSAADVILGGAPGTATGVVLTRGEGL